VGQDAGEPFVPVVVQPGVNGVGIAVAEQAAVGHGLRGVPVSDLEQGGAALTDVGLGVVVAVGEHFGALVVRERQGTALVHREAPLWVRYTIIRPYRTCSSTFISIDMYYHSLVRHDLSGNAEIEPGTVSQISAAANDMVFAVALTDSSL
jgi:hypothetical protein